MSGVFRRSRVVAPEDTDFLGHVNNIVWLQFVIDLAEAHATRGSRGTELARADGATWIVKRHELDYLQNAVPGEEIIEETWVESMRGARSIRCCRFTRASDRSPLVTTSTQWAYVDARTLRPRRIPRELLAAFEKD